MLSNSDGALTEAQLAQEFGYGRPRAKTPKGSQTVAWFEVGVSACARGTVRAKGRPGRPRRARPAPPVQRRRHPPPLQSRQSQLQRKLDQRRRELGLVSPRVEGGERRACRVADATARPPSLPAADAPAPPGSCSHRPLQGRATRAQRRDPAHDHVGPGSCCSRPRPPRCARARAGRGRGGRAHGRQARQQQRQGQGSASERSGGRRRRRPARRRQGCRQRQRQRQGLSSGLPDDGDRAGAFRTWKAAASARTRV